MNVNKLAQLLEWMVRNSKLLSRVMLVIMGILVIANFMYSSDHHDRFFWESLPAAGAIYGLFSCVVIVVVSKFLGYSFLYRPEDYYDNESKPNELIGNPENRENRDA